MGIIKTPLEIEKMRIASQLTAKVLEALTEYIKPGLTTMEVNDFCEQYIINELHAIPGSKGQYGYPYAVNTSLNHVICHGMPSAKQVLKTETSSMWISLLSKMVFTEIAVKCFVSVRFRLMQKD